MLSTFRSSFSRMPARLCPRTFAIPAMSVRWKSSSSSRFVSYEKAREYVRTLDLTSSKEWKSYSSSGERPHFIPSNPSDFYGDFVSFADFCGYTSTRRQYERREKLINAEPVQKTYKDANMMRWVEDYFATNVSNIECYRLPYEVKGSLLVRFKDSENPDDSWMRLHVRGSNQINPPCQRYTFGDAIDALTDGAICVKACNSEIFLVPGHSIGAKHIHIGPQSKYVQYRAESSTAVEEVLRKWFDSELPRRSLREWVEEEQPERERLSAPVMLFQAKDSFDRCNLPMGFLHRDADANIMLGKYKILHRVAGERDDASIHCFNVRETFVTENGRRFDRPIKYDSDIDIVLASIVDYNTSLLQGFFLLPRPVLKQHFLSENHTTSYVSLHLPDTVPRYRLAKKRQQERLRYYVDLKSGEEEVEGKILDILAEVDAFKEGEAASKGEQEEGSSSHVLSSSTM